ncbi:unnamed protein product, partial [Caretta caretta]
PTRSDPGHRPDLGTQRHPDTQTAPPARDPPTARRPDTQTFPPPPRETPQCAGVLSEYLQEAVPLIIPHEQCRSPGLHGARVTADMLCASYLQGGTNACQ